MDQLKKEIIEVCKLSGTFKTRSGQTVDTYFDKYQFEGRPALLRRIAAALSQKLNLEFDIFAGLEMGGIPVATALSLETGKPVCFVRKAAKTYGTERIFEGPDVRGRNVLIVEDVTTTGGQILLSADALKNAGATIVGVVLVIARAQEAVQTLADAHLQLISLITPDEIAVLS